MAKSLQKAFCFLDNYIKIGCCKFSLLQKIYLSSAVNVLTKNQKTSHITKRDIFHISFHQSDEKKIDKSTFMQISQLFETL